jgi:hypothetical protein
MSIPLTPEMILAISFAMRDLLGTLLQSLADMTPEEREAWRAVQMKKKIEHDEWLDQHLGGP